MSSFTFIKRAKDTKERTLGDWATTLGVMLSPQIPATMSGMYVKKLVGNPPINPTNEYLIAGIKDIIRKDKDIFQGISIGLDTQPSSTITKTTNGKILKYINQPSFNDPAILAHEYGHTQNKMMNRALDAARQNKKIPPISNLLYAGGKIAPGLVAAGSLLTDDENTSLIANSLGSATAAPTLWEEFTASHKGSKALQEAAKMKNIKLTALQKLRPYMGIPTYAALAAFPLATHFGRKWGIGFKDNANKKEK